MKYKNLNAEIQKSEVYDGKIMIGTDHQADIPDLLTVKDTPDRSTLVWSAEQNCDLTDDQWELLYEVAATLYDKYLIDLSSNRLRSAYSLREDTRTPGQRDALKQSVHNAMHQTQYYVPAALLSVVLNFDQIRSRDELEKFSESDKIVFEKVIDRCDRDFLKIKQKFMPHKSVKSLINYYYTREKPEKKRFSRSFNITPKAKRRRSSADSLNKEEEKEEDISQTTIAGRWRPSAFYLRVSVYFKVTRRYKVDQLKLRAAARNPFRLI